MNAQKSKARKTWMAYVVCTTLMIFGLSSHATGFGQDRVQAMQILVTEASSAQARGDFVAAADSYQKAVDIDSSIPELWANLGLMYHQIGKRAEAIQSFEKAIELNPSLFVPQLFLGIEYLAAKKPETAIPFLKGAVKLNPRDLQATLSLGKAYSMLDQGSQAAEAYWNATSIAPRNGSIWLGLGTSYLQQVESDARLLNSKFESSPYVSLRAAETFAEQGKYIEAEAAFKTALAAPAPAPCAHAEYGIALLHMKNSQAAQRQFQLEMQNISPCGLAPLGTAVVQLTQGDWNSGLSVLSSITSKEPRFVQTNLPLFREVLSADQNHALLETIRVQESSGDLAATLGDLIDGALLSDEMPSTDNLDDAGLANEQQPRSPNDAVHLKAGGEYSACEKEDRSGANDLTIAQEGVLAFCSFYSGDFRAAALAAQALEANSSTVVQGLYWESKADQKLAIAAFTRAGELEPNSPQMWVLIGDVFRQKRRWSEAEMDYRKAVALNPKSRTARLNLAIVLFTQLKDDEALELDDSLLEEEPDDPEANLLAGEILVQQHEYEKAEPHFQKCGKLTQDLQPRLHILLGQVYSETNRIPEAITEYKMGLSTDHDGSIHYQLARLYQKAGNFAEASEQIRISKQLRERWDNQAHVALEQRSTDLSRQ